MRVRTCLVFIALAAVAAAENAIVDDLVNKVTDSATSAANEAVTDATDAAANYTGNAVHHAANYTGNYVDSTLDSAGSKLDDEGRKVGSTPASGSSAASSMHQSSIVIMTTLAVAGLALNFV